MTERKRGPGRGKPVEPLEEKIGQDGVAKFIETPDEVDAQILADERVDAILVKPDQEVVESEAFKEKVANLEFMEEMVLIHIHDTAEKDADPRFDISVNGRRTTFQRGKEYTVKRYIVEGLARAKPVHYENEEYDENGVRGTRYPSRTGLRYGFSVLRDMHPRGGEWLKAILAQP